ncbi:hypothetical protein [Shimia sp. MMG029]|uniref:hypothetical protein n=1 Tax=Shimia sp. MMG029 TaxID=3021978 RepID=UPI0022FDECF7|nr:hypothetical protein [Shimia sp. MMG029]MDA5556051.1 hypothetical protein [Shimia sp. MMG029]
MKRHKKNKSKLKGPGFLRRKEIDEAIKTWRPEIMNAVLRIADAKEAAKRLEALTTSAYWAVLGADKAAAQVERDGLKVEIERVTAAKDQTWAQLLACPEVLPAAAVRQGDESGEGYNETPFWSYQLRHKLGVLILAPLLGVALSASWLSAHANLVGSQLEVFIENKALPWTMAAIAPMASVALKTMYAHLSSDRARKLYKTLLLVCTSVSILTWAVLFALVYKGLGTDFDISTLFAEPTLWGSLQQTGFVVATLTTEILVGGVIALRLGQIADLYAANGEVPNSERRYLKRQWDDLKAELAGLEKRLGEVEGFLATLNHALEAEIALARISHDARRAQNDTPII